MKKIEIFAFGEVEYRYFFDIDTQTEGIEIYLNNNRLGSALIQMPDEDEEEDVERFKKELEEWMFNFDDQLFNSI